MSSDFSNKASTSLETAFHPKQTVLGVGGDGHRRIERLYLDGCAEVGRRFAGYEEKQLEQRIAMCLCQNASGFVMIDTQPRRTIIGLEHHEDAEAFRREFL